MGMSHFTFDNLADAVAKAQDLSDSFRNVFKAGVGVFSDGVAFHVEPGKHALGVCVAYFKAGAEHDPFTAQEKAMNMAQREGWRFAGRHLAGLAMTHPESEDLRVFANDGTETRWS